ncbi:hypothetical protein RTBOTA2_006306, partial [Rhodotorula toruloides]
EGWHRLLHAARAGLRLIDSEPPNYSARPAHPASDLTHLLPHTLLLILVDSHSVHSFNRVELPHALCSSPVRIRPPMRSPPPRPFDHHPSSRLSSSPRSLVRLVPVALALLATVFLIFRWATAGDEAKREYYEPVPGEASRKSGRLRRLSPHAPSTPRSGLSALIERACGETEPHVPAWIDHLSSLEENCPDMREEERESVRRWAVRQCGAWCIWDLSTPEQVGWHLESRCFKRFDSREGPHVCDQWWFQRPKVELAEAHQEGRRGSGRGGT